MQNPFDKFWAAFNIYEIIKSRGWEQGRLRAKLWERETEFGYFELLREAGKILDNRLK
jgi:hypothetical protein